MFKEMWKVLARYGIVPWNDKPLLGKQQPAAHTRDGYWEDLVDERQTEEHERHDTTEDTRGSARGAEGAV